MGPFLIHQARFETLLEMNSPWPNPSPLAAVMEIGRKQRPEPPLHPTLAGAPGCPGFGTEDAKSDTGFLVALGTFLFSRLRFIIGQMELKKKKSSAGHQALL